MPERKHHWRSETFAGGVGGRWTGWRCMTCGLYCRTHDSSEPTEKNTLRGSGPLLTNLGVGKIPACSPTAWERIDAE